MGGRVLGRVSDSQAPWPRGVAILLLTVASTPGGGKCFPDGVRSCLPLMGRLGFSRGVLESPTMGWKNRRRGAGYGGGAPLVKWGVPRMLWYRGRAPRPIRRARQQAHGPVLRALPRGRPWRRGISSGG